MIMSLVLLTFMVRRLLESQTEIRFKSDWRVGRSEDVAIGLESKMSSA